MLWRCAAALVKLSPDQACDHVQSYIAGETLVRAHTIMAKGTKKTPFRLLRKESQDPERVAAGVTTGAAWYSEADWRRVREIAADPERLEATYDDWCRMFERSLRDLAQQGLAVERIPIRADELEAWCQQQSRVVDAAARSEFACELLARRRS